MYYWQLLVVRLVFVLLFEVRPATSLLTFRLQLR